MTTLLDDDLLRRGARRAERALARREPDLLAGRFAPERTSWPAADPRVADVRFDADRIVVDLMDGRTVAAPLAWFPRLLNATPAQRAHWERSAAGYALHWPDVDEDLSTEGLLRGAPAAA